MSKANTTKLRTTKAVRNTIKSIIRASTALQTRIHSCALECLRHAQKYGDCTLANELYRGLPRGQRTESLRKWFEEYSPIRFKSDGGVGMLSKDAKTYTKFNVATAERKPYYIKVETVTQPLTMQQLIDTINRLETQVVNARDGKSKREIAEGEDVEAMLTLARNAKASIGLAPGNA